VARAHGLAPREPSVLGDGSNVLVHLAPAPVVARIATTTALIRPNEREWLARELEVAHFLASRRAPVVPPSDELPPGPHERDGLFLTFWRFVDHDASRAPEVTEVASTLADLHGALREYPGELPLLDPALDEVDRGLDYLETHGALGAEDLALVRAAHARVRHALEQDSRPRQPLHGDAHVSNVLQTRDGLLWGDFEDTCSGPITWDLACLTGSSALSQEPALSAYGDAPSRPELEFFLEARELQSIMWYAVSAQRFPERRGQAEARVRAWQDQC
jgi:thiamine kinase-like enzyme